jgi:hypothetical protein
MTIMRLAIITLALAGTASAQQSCPQFAALAAQALPPTVGSQQLVGTMLAGAESFTASGLATRFDHRQAMLATGTRLKAPRTCPRAKDRRNQPASFACDYVSPQDPRISLDVDVPAGRVTFIDGARRFDPTGPDNATTPAAALEVAARVIEGLGAPPAEIGLEHAKVSARMLASAATGGGGPPLIRRMEVIASVPRLVNDFPVLDSRATVAVDGEGRPARAHVVWPDFRLAPGLSDTTPLSRTRVIASIVETMGSFAGSCDGFAKMRVGVGWVSGATTDLSDEQGAPQQPGRYLPGIAVQVAPPASGEDSGQIEDFVHSFTLAIVTADTNPSDG